MDFTFITGPPQCHGVKTAQGYLDMQKRILLEIKKAGVGPGNLPHEATIEEELRTSLPFISAGAWKIMCGCNNAPSVSFEWDLACCFECGAIYHHLPIPLDKDKIEKILLYRIKRYRNWNSESIDILIEQNKERGDKYGL